VTRTRPAAAAAAQEGRVSAGTSASVYFQGHSHRATGNLKVAVKPLTGPMAESASLSLSSHRDGHGHGTTGHMSSWVAVRARSSGHAGRHGQKC
jgi:hypothetical protein